VTAAETHGLLLKIDPQTKRIDAELAEDLRSELLLAPLTRYLAASAELSASARIKARAEWRAALEATADWLGAALLSALMRISHGSPEIRLVAVGHLNVLPLQIARRPDTGT
jgi:hypothetical protein